MEPFFNPANRVLLPSGRVEWAPFTLLPSIDRVSLWMSNWFIRDYYEILDLPDQCYNMAQRELDLVNAHILACSPSHTVLMPSLVEITFQCIGRFQGSLRMRFDTTTRKDPDFPVTVTSKVILPQARDGLQRRSDVVFA
jgi:hypothetical protein